LGNAVRKSRQQLGPDLSGFAKSPKQKVRAFEEAGAGHGRFRATSRALPDPLLDGSPRADEHEEVWALGVSHRTFCAPNSGAAVSGLPRIACAWFAAVDCQLPFCSAVLGAFLLVERLPILLALGRGRDLGRQRD